jgi:hypothetical protein
MKKEYYPDFIPMESNLSCDYPHNPRYIWSSMRQLNLDDITEFYNETKIMSTNEEQDENSSTDSSKSLLSSALVLLPKLIDNDFINYPNVNYLNNISNLNVSCIHREEIPLFYGIKSFISINFPHLLLGKSIDLLNENIKLDPMNLINIMCTCLDLSMSPVSCLICATLSSCLILTGDKF